MKQILPLRSIGKSDLMITPIGLGCWQFSKQQNMAGKFWPKMEDDLIKQMVKISLKAASTGSILPSYMAMKFSLSDDDLFQLYKKSTMIR